MRNYKLKDKTHYLNKITSQETLVSIALNQFRYESEGVRIAAINKITDEAMLCQLAMDLKESNLQELVLQKITDTDTLKYFAFNGNYALRKIAVERLEDEEVLAEKLLETDDIDFINIIINKLSNESLKKIKTDDWFINAIISDILR